MPDLTDAQVRALGFLADKMWASARMVGGAIGEDYEDRQQRCGALVLGYLRRIGLVSRDKQRLWRITAAGRVALGKQIDA